MTINITKEIKAAYEAFLDVQIDAYFSGEPILRRHTWPYCNGPHTGLVDFAAGWQSATLAKAASVERPGASGSDGKEIGTPLQHLGRAGGTS